MTDNQLFLIGFCFLVGTVGLGIMFCHYRDTKLAIAKEEKDRACAAAGLSQVTTECVKTSSETVLWSHWKRV